MQAYFGVEGTMLMADGTEKIVNAETKEDVRAGGSEVGMGAIMAGGAVGSVRSGVKGRKVQQEQTQKQTEFSKNVEEVAKSEAKPLNETVNLTAKETPAKINTPSQAKIVEMYPDKSLMPKAKAKTEPAKTAEAPAPAKPSISQELKAQLTDALKDVKYDKNEVLTMIDKYPDVVTKLAEYKTPDGELLFKPAEINGILSNCKNIIENNPQAIYDILDNPQSRVNLSGYEDKGLGLFRMLYF